MVTYSSRTQSALRELVAITRQYESVAEGDRKTASSPGRHKVFVSYHAIDAVEVLQYIEENTDAFIPRAIGMEEDGSDIINSTNVAYIRQTIKTKYLRDSTVTLVAIGECTWARNLWTGRYTRASAPTLLRTACYQSSCRPSPGPVPASPRDCPPTLRRRTRWGTRIITSHPRARAPFGAGFSTPSMGGSLVRPCSMLVANYASGTRHANRSEGRGAPERRCLLAETVC